MKSKLFSLAIQDYIKGIIMAFIMAFVTSIYQWVSNGSFPTGAQLKTAGIVGLGAALAYLLKNFGTNSQGKFMSKEPTPRPK